MAYLDDLLLGQKSGGLTPEGQSLWDQYTNMLNSQQNAPMRQMRMPKGNLVDIVDPGYLMKNKLLSNTLHGMTSTGLGTREKAQPGLFAQLAPLFIAAGIKDPNEIMKMIRAVTGSGAETTPDLTTGSTGSLDYNPDWFQGGGDIASNVPSLVEDIPYW